MRPSMDVGVGIVLMVIGILKAWSHAVSASTLTVPGCFGGDFVLQLNSPIWHRVHCWGCYVALAGFALLVWAAYRHFSQSRLAFVV